MNLFGSKKGRRNLLVLGLAVIVLLELAWATGYLKKPSLPSAPAATPSAEAESYPVTLSFSPSMETYTVDQTFTVEIVLGAEEETVTTGVDLKLYFDSQKLEVLDVSSSDFYPQRLKNTIDAEEGIIRLALTNTPDQEEVKGGGVIGTITFKALEAGETGIDFEEGSIIAGTSGTNLLNFFGLFGGFSSSSNFYPQTTPATFVIETQENL